MVLLLGMECGRQAEAANISLISLLLPLLLLASVDDDEVI